MAKISIWLQLHPALWLLESQIAIYLRHHRHICICTVSKGAHKANKVGHSNTLVNISILTLNVQLQLELKVPCMLEVLEEQSVTKFGKIVEADDLVKKKKTFKLLNGEMGTRLMII